MQSQSSVEGQAIRINTKAIGGGFQDLTGEIASVFSDCEEMKTAEERGKIEGECSRKKPYIS